MILAIRDLILVLAVIALILLFAFPSRAAQTKIEIIAKVAQFEIWEVDGQPCVYAPHIDKPWNGAPYPDCLEIIPTS